MIKENKMDNIKTEIVAHSKNLQGDELITVLATFPRIILAEVNTHRMLSKNTSSSRAIPFNKMVESVQNDPFIPIAWQKEHKGMQGTEYHEDTHKLVEGWLTARNSAIQIAEGLNNNKVTKQLANRLLEPFMWTTMLITGSKEGWDNFFRLRCPSYETETGIYKSKKDAGKYAEYGTVPKYFDDIIGWLQLNKGQAEIHIMDLAEKIYDALNESTPKKLKAGEWHIPFENKLPELKVAYTEDGLDYKEKCTLEDKIAMSVAMAARTSYTVVGHEKELNAHSLIGLHDRLLVQDPPHSSPMEHACVCVSQEEYNNSFKGQEKGWFRNYKGFKSYRQIIEENR